MSSSFESYVVKDRDDSNKKVPFIVSPPRTNPLSSSQDVSNFIKSNRKQIDEALSEHGAILFRGFPLDDVNDFDTFVRSWEDWQDLSYDRSMSFAVRHKLSDRICTTNEGKVR